MVHLAWLGEAKHWQSLSQDFYEKGNKKIFGSVGSRYRVTLLPFMACEKDLKAEFGSGMCVDFVAIKRWFLPFLVCKWKNILGLITDFSHGPMFIKLPCVPN